MKKTAARVVLAIALLLVGCSQISAAPRSAARTEMDSVSAAVSGDTAWGHVQALAGDIGSRPAGTAPATRAADYIASTFAAYGYTVERQPFPITYYDDRGSSLEIGDATGWRPSTNTLAYSPSGAVDGDLVYVGLARPGDFYSPSLAGKVALIERGEIRFSEKVERVAAAGAIGAVIYNNLDGNFSGSLATTAPIPALSLSREDGLALLTSVQSGTARARLAVDSSIAQSSGVNVVATRHGGPSTVIVGAHFDSVRAGPGANDNGSGVATLLEVARVLTAHQSPFTIKLVAFDAEEIGLVGSGAAAASLDESTRQKVIAMMNLDMVGVGTTPRYSGSEDLLNVAMQASLGLGQVARPLGEGTLAGASDHASFARFGVPTLFVYRSDDPNYHGPNDRPELVSPANLAFAARVVLAVLDHLEQTR